MSPSRPDISVSFVPPIAATALITSYEFMVPTYVAVPSAASASRK